MICRGGQRVGIVRGESAGRVEGGAIRGRADIEDLIDVGRETSAARYGLKLRGHGEGYGRAPIEEIQG